MQLSARRTRIKRMLARATLIGLAFAFVILFLVLPLCVVFLEAFRRGWAVYVGSLVDPATTSAIRLTVLSALVAVPLNALFGVAVAWLVTRFTFYGRGLVLAFIDMPLAVSPVIAGMMFVLLYGSRGLLGPWLSHHDIKVIFAIPGILLVTTFVTLPYVARELIALMDQQGSEEEEVALTLGASATQMFRLVTLPKVRWGLFYGVILCNARAMGEFGAVSVVSGHIRGYTNTMPLHIETLYNEYNFAAAFSVASLLTLLALLTLIAKNLMEFYFKDKLV